jgi:glycolate oxidase FAD binding subunit
MYTAADFPSRNWSDSDVSQDTSQALRESVLAAEQERRALHIVGGGSKGFLGRPTTGESLEVASNRGIVNYEPVELVLTARTGTPLSELETALEGQGQLLPFEPPHFGETATLGGTIAAGLSGPRRPYSGAARDFVLGCKLINGRGEILHFGGEVMKNVAGYDVSRLMAGAFGTLGVLLEISLKVLPKPAAEITLVQHRTADEALRVMNIWAGKPLPVSAACYDGNQLYVRLSGAGSAVAAARERIGGEVLSDGGDFWHRLREHQHTFFGGNKPLWRISVPPTAPLLDLEGKWFIDWGGAQRWLRSEANPQDVWRTAQQAGGHATLFRGEDKRAGVFQPLPTAMIALHRKLKRSFDPNRIFNPGRMYPDL